MACISKRHRLRDQSRHDRREQQDGVYIDSVGTVNNEGHGNIGGMIMACIFNSGGLGSVINPARSSAQTTTEFTWVPAAA